MGLLLSVFAMEPHKSWESLLARQPLSISVASLLAAATSTGLRGQSSGPRGQRSWPQSTQGHHGHLPGRVSSGLEYFGFGLSVGSQLGWQSLYDLYGSENEEPDQDWDISGYGQCPLESVEAKEGHPNHGEETLHTSVASSSDEQTNLSNGYIDTMTKIRNGSIINKKGFVVPNPAWYQHLPVSGMTYTQWCSSLGKFSVKNSRVIFHRSVTTVESPIPCIHSLGIWFK